MSAYSNSDLQQILDEEDLFDLDLLRLEP